MSTTARVHCGDRCTTLDELRLDAARAAGGLAALGVGPGDAVALLLRNDIPFLTATLAAAATGASPTPVNWHSTADEVAYLLADSGAKVLVAHADLLRALPGLDLSGVEVLAVGTPPDVAADYDVPEAACRVPTGVTDWSEWLVDHHPLSTPAGSPFSVIYTSGTTGRPKGVKRGSAPPDHQAALAGLAARLLGMRPGATVLLPAPLYHSAPNAAAIFAVHFGCTLVLVPRFEPEQLLALVERHRVTTMPIVPAMFNRLLRLDPEVRGRYDVGSLEHVAHTAAPCPVETKRRMIEWWGPIIAEFYGSTETGAVTYCTSDEWLAHPGTVGRPVPEATLRVLDAFGKELPTGEVGEIFARLAPMSDFTYHSRDDLRREIEVDGLITSGDLGYLDDDGYLFVCDRKKDMVIIGGSNVYPAEIEAELSQLPGVADCAVFGIPDDDLGEVLAAVVEPEPGAELDPEVLRAGLAERLASFKVPRVFEFRADLPREDSGKLFKRRLREPYWAGTGRRI